MTLRLITIPLIFSLGQQSVVANAAHARRQYTDHLHHKIQARSTSISADLSTHQSHDSVGDLTTTNDCLPSTTTTYTTVYDVPSEDATPSTTTVYTTVFGLSPEQMKTLTHTSALPTTGSSQAAHPDSNDHTTSHIETSGSIFVSQSFSTNQNAPLYSGPAFSAVSSELTSSLAPSSAPSSQLLEPSSCPMAATNFDSFPVMFGFNMVNTKPYDIHSNDKIKAGSEFRTEQDWQDGMASLKTHFSNINAVRLYSTTDGPVQHLNNSLAAAKQNQLKILAGLWSTATGPDKPDSRFNTELDALDAAITSHGCDQIGAVSVGNEGLNDLNKIPTSDPTQARIDLVDALINQISQTRALLRNRGCCSVPVTHTDTWNELFNTTSPWVTKLISAVDQAIVVNIFPWWGNADDQSMTEQISDNARMAKEAAASMGKDIWLGETGWAHTLVQPVSGITSVADRETAQKYFRAVGCQVLSGRGTAFYYVDWDEDKEVAGSQSPSFGLFTWDYQPKFSLDCSDVVEDGKLGEAGVGWL